LVQNEPEKLAYFNGLEMPSAIPPFIPAEKDTSANVIARSEATKRLRLSSENPTQSNERTKTTLSIQAKRRRYTYGMAAAAACFVVFISITAVSLTPGMEMEKMSADYSSAEAGGGEVAAADTAAPETAPEVPAEIAEAPAPAPEAAEPEALSGESPAAAIAPQASPLPDAEVEESPATEKTESYDMAGSPQEYEDSEELSNGVMGTDDGTKLLRTDASGQNLESSYTFYLYNAGAGFYIALICSIICAALFVVFLIRRRNLR